MESSGTGPDIVIPGSARSGSTFLAALLDQHPEIALASTKEPEYFNFKWDLGPAWYDSFFPPRDSGVLRLDATVSYTYPEAEPALERLAESSPNARIIYVVRDPVARLRSHFLHFRDYVGIEPSPSLSVALAESPYGYLSASDYGYWISRLASLFGTERVLVLPLPALSSSPQAVLDTVFDHVGVAPASVDIERVKRFRNESVQPRNRWTGQAIRWALGSRSYPVLRNALGPDRLRWLRQALTTSTPTSVTDEAATLTAAQRQALQEVTVRAADFVAEWLRLQDSRLATDWAGHRDAASWPAW